MLGYILGIRGLKFRVEGLRVRVKIIIVCFVFFCFWGFGGFFGGFSWILGVSGFYLGFFLGCLGVFFSF